MPYDLKWPLLEIVEGLIAAHQAAKVDGDKTSIDLIEAALSHAGQRLSKEAESHGIGNIYEKRGSGGHGDCALSGLEGLGFPRLRGAKRRTRGKSRPQ